MNLTAVTDEAEVMTRHVADTLAVLPPLERAYRARSSTGGGGGIDGVSLIDVGSGAGLPGLILAVARPSKRLSPSRQLVVVLRKPCAKTLAAAMWICSVCFQAGDLHCWSQ